MATLHKFDAQLDFVDQDIEDVITDLLIHLKEDYMFVQVKLKP